MIPPGVPTPAQILRRLDSADYRRLVWATGCWLEAHHEVGVDLVERAGRPAVDLVCGYKRPNYHTVLVLCGETNTIALLDEAADWKTRWCPETFVALAEEGLTSETIGLAKERGIGLLIVKKGHLPADDDVKQYLTPRREACNMPGTTRKRASRIVSTV